MTELRGRQYGLLVVGVLVAIAVNLVFCRWGMDLGGSSMLTFNLQDTPEAMPGASSTIGLYTAPWMAQAAAMAWILGIGLPIVLVISAMAVTWWPITGKTRSS
ncbi:MAG: hypothetical protein P8J86_05640 [Phycisphaerales bacterium]|nr:hypothetical protein [Phycisphaerales bacterium]